MPPKPRTSKERTTDIELPDIATTGKVVRSGIGSDNSLAGWLIGACVIIALNWKEGIRMTRKVCHAFLDEAGHVGVSFRRLVPA